MQYTFDQLKGLTVVQLREIAAGIEHESVKGYTQLNKEHLLTAICTALNIDTHTRHKSKIAGRGKIEIKAHMKELKGKRDAALGAHDHAGLKAIRRQLHELRRWMRISRGKCLA